MAIDGPANVHRTRSPAQEAVTMAENKIEWYCTDCEQKTVPIATAFNGRDEHRCKMCGGGRLFKLTATDTADTRVRQTSGADHG